MRELISIVVPVYNLEKYIERALKSILGQTYSNIEIVVVDDGSTDRSWNVIQKIARQDSRILVVKQENAGVTEARLNGVRYSSGQWIGFMDGDDEIEPDMYEMLFKNAVKYDAEISHCGYQMIFDDGRINYFHNTGCVVQQDNLTGLKDLLDGSFVEPGLWNKIFHRSLFHKLLCSDVMNTEIKINEDLLMNYYLFSTSKKSVFQDICKYHYMVRRTSTTRSMLNEHRIYDPIKVKQIIIDTIPEPMKEDALRVYIRTCVYVYSGLVLDNTKKFLLDEVAIRKKIIEGKSYIHLMDKKQKLMAYLILYIPAIYKLIYRLYAKYFLKSKYD